MSDAALVQVIGIAGSLVFPAASPYILLATSIVSGVVGNEEQRRAQRRLAESQKRDLLTMVRSAEEPHRVIYGTARVSGPIAFVHGTGGDHGQLYIVVCLAGHEVHAFRSVIFNETGIGVTNGGVLPGSGYFGTSIQDYIVKFTIPANRQIALPVTGTFSTLLAVTTVGEILNEAGMPIAEALGVSLTNTLDTSGVFPVVTVTDTAVSPGTDVFIWWAEWQGAPLVDVATYLGTPTQAADASLIGASDQQWTSDHRLLGRAYVRVRLQWDTTRFNAGPPNITARIDGKECFDPRDSSTIWTINPALCIRDYLTNSQFGLRCDDSEIDDDSFIEAANVCDEFIQVDTSTISDPTVAAAWQNFLSDATRLGTWEPDGDAIFEDFDQDNGLTGISANIFSVGLLTGTGLPVDGQTCLTCGATTDGGLGTVALSYLGSNIPAGRVDLHFLYRGIPYGEGLWVRYTNSGSNQTGYLASFNPYALNPNSFGFFKVVNNVATTLALGTPSITSNTIHKLSIAYSDSDVFSVYLDDVLLVTVDESGTSVTNGGVAIHTTSHTLAGLVNYFPDINVQIGAVADVKKFRQRRYACNGVFTVDQAPATILQRLLSSCAGMLTYTGGVHRLVVGAYRTPTLTLTQDDVVGNLSIIPRASYRDLFNAVRGKYRGPDQFDQETDFPPVTNADYETADGGDQIASDLDLPFTNDPVMAQRVAKVNLERARRAIIVQGSFRLKAIALRPGDTVMLNLPKFSSIPVGGVSPVSWTAKVFRVNEWALRCDDDFRIEMSLQEEDAESYDWSIDDAIVDGQGTTITGPPDPPPQSSAMAAQQIIYDDEERILFAEELVQ